MKQIILICLSVLLALCLVQAQTPSSSQQVVDSQVQNDINTLKYALTLENLEAAFYAAGQRTFTASQFAAAGLPTSAYSYLNLIGAHEQAHVALLTSVLGANAVPACTYNFTNAFSSVAAYISVARTLEETGVAAYDGAANRINSGTYLQVAAQIVTVEARHASYLNQLLSYIAYFNATGIPYQNITDLMMNTTFAYSPFPNSFDVPLTPTAVLAATAGIIVSCPYTVVPPVISFTVTPYNFPGISVFNSSGQYVTSDQYNNDNNLLNYALTLELFGVAFYNNVSRFNANDFNAAGYSTAVYNNVQMIIAHERAHAAFLTSVLTSRGATPARSCTYNIASYTSSVANALAFARMLENLEVTAYDGAINRLTQYDLLQGAATIATVEGRHANYLDNVVTGTGVQNSTLDMANDPTSILTMTAAFFGPDCVRPVIPQYAYALQPQFLATFNTPTATSTYSASSTYSATPNSATPSRSGSASRLSSLFSWVL